MVDIETIDAKAKDFLKALWEMNQDDLQKQASMYVIGDTLGLDRDSALGDITTEMVLGDEKREVEAEIVSKDEGILAGREEVEDYLNYDTRTERGQSEALIPSEDEVTKLLGITQSSPRLCPTGNYELNFKDGDKIKKGDVILKIKGDAATILKIERAILNFLGRMSGVATVMNEYVKKVPIGQKYRSAVFEEILKSTLTAIKKLGKDYPRALMSIYPIFQRINQGTKITGQIGEFLIQKTH